MSSSSVCQGLQSCLEPRVIEPRVLRLKLAPPGSNFSPPSSATTVIIPPPSSDQEKPLLIDNECDKKDTKSRGWSFLQALADNPDCKNKNEKSDNVYVHPTVKCSSSMLSEKSLEMCTESLGSETGSNAGESSDDVSLFSLHDDTVVVLGGGSNMNWGGVNRRVKHKACSFPPPLTSITDFHVRPHREGGRLILEAVASPSRTPYFQAERGDGRLTLRLFNGGFGFGFGSDDDEEEGEEEEEEEEEEEGEEVSGEEEELEDCVENVEDEMGVKKFARPSRCKESGNRDIFGDGYFELPSLSLCL